jgi:sec-independent protein translocase protein TatB
MFGFEFSHILVLAAIALIVLGPKQMPQLAKVLGRTIGELKKAMRDVTSEMSAVVVDSHKDSKAKEPTAQPQIENPTDTVKKENS